VNGFDVMTAFACKPGKIVGDILNTLFADVEQGTLPNEREALLAKIEELHTQT
jgi:hypothetical protein